MRDPLKGITRVIIELRDKVEVIPKPQYRRVIVEHKRVHGRRYVVTGKVGQVHVARVRQPEMVFDYSVDVDIALIIDAAGEVAELRVAGGAERAEEVIVDC